MNVYVDADVVVTCVKQEDGMGPAFDYEAVHVDCFGPGKHAYGWGHNVQEALADLRSDTGR